MKNAAASLWREQSGQATTEYVLMLAVSLAVGIIVIKNFLQPMAKRIQDYAVGRMNSLLFGADLHQIRLGK
jgi:Flp pilus assembly pilin Flp